MRLRHTAAATGVAALLLFSSGAFAAHGSFNPMMPRQLTESAAAEENTFGYSILPGRAVDSLEGLNREMWFLNYDILDRYILRPVSHGYASLPEGIRNGVGNFLSNLDDLPSVPNNMLVGDFAASGRSAARFIINTTIGILGIFDPASAMGIEKSAMSMATVLGKGGADQGPFLMVPVYGPTTARNLQGDTIDGLPYFAISWPVTLVKWTVSGIHNRSLVIDQEPLVDNAIDPYIQTRDAYLMYEENKINPVEEGVVENTDDIDESLLDEIDG